MNGRSGRAKGVLKEVAGIIRGRKDVGSEGKAPAHAADAERTIHEGMGKIQAFVDKTDEKGQNTMTKIRDARA